jgi:hypothetical protein
MIYKSTDFVLDSIHSMAVDYDGVLVQAKYKGKPSMDGTTIQLKFVEENAVPALRIDSYMQQLVWQVETGEVAEELPDVVFKGYGVRPLKFFSLHNDSLRVVLNKWITFRKEGGEAPSIESTYGELCKKYTHGIYITKDELKHWRRYSDLRIIKDGVYEKIVSHGMVATLCNNGEYRVVRKS